MYPAWLWPFFWAIVIGASIEVFFQLVKYQDALNKRGPRPPEMTNYQSVSGYLSNGNRKWGRYLLFRFTPPALMFLLLGAVLQRYFCGHYLFQGMMIAAAVSLIPRNAVSLFKARFIKERILHISICAGVFLSAVIISVICKATDISFIAPNIDGLFDNLWSSLIVAGLVLIYFQMTDMSGRRNDGSADENTINNYVIQSYSMMMKHYGKAIVASCRHSNCSIPIVYSIIIYENINRPKFVRILENLLTQLFHTQLTVGIAQVRSCEPLTDEESIVKACQLLQGSAQLLQGREKASVALRDPRYKGKSGISLYDYLHKYNPSDEYVNEVIKIIKILCDFEQQLFDEASAAEQISQ